MNVITRRKQRAPAVKRAISLPRDVDEQIADLSQKEGKSYSSVVQLAVIGFLKRYEDLKMEMAYRAYYDNPVLKEEGGRLAADLLALSGAGWPESMEDTTNARQKRRGRMA